MIDRTYRPWRVAHDVGKGFVLGSLLHLFFMVTLEQAPTGPKPQMVLAALILFSTVFARQFERYFPPVEEYKESSGDKQ